MSLFSLVISKQKHLTKQEQAFKTKFIYFFCRFLCGGRMAEKKEGTNHKVFNKLAKTAQHPPLDQQIISGNFEKKGNYVKSTRFFVMYEKSIYYYNVESFYTFILIWPPASRALARARIWVLARARIWVHSLSAQSTSSAGPARQTHTRAASLSDTRQAAPSPYEVE